MLEPDYIVPDEPSGLVVVPGLQAVDGMLAANADGSRAWDFRIGELDATAFAAAARRSSMQVARTYCSERGISFRETSGPLLVTGHQPLLFHPGVWVKNFLVDALAGRFGGTGLNLVVDTDAAGEVGIDVPRADGQLLRMSRHTLVRPRGADVPYETVEAPDSRGLDEFRRTVAADLATLPRRDAAAAFDEFANALGEALDRSGNLGELLTGARRRYENAAGTAYLELPVSLQCDTDEFLVFFLAVSERIEEFRDVYNACLDEYRERYEIRSAANPFPDLDVNGDLVESPFWLMDAKGLRATLWLKRQGDLSMVCHANGCKVELARGAYADNIAKLRAEGIHIRPKALILTLFNRLFVADLFVHGVGGAKYDRASDEIARRFFGVEPPGYVAATATVRLETGVELPSGATVAELLQRLHALEHNPDRFAGDPSVDESLRPQLASLGREKAELVGQIAREDADKKALGARIRDVNARIAALLAPLRAATQEAIAGAGQAQESRRVMAYREFPYCYWRPDVVRDLVTRALAATGLDSEE